MNWNRIEKSLYLFGLICVTSFFTASCGLYHASVDEQIANSKEITSTVPVQNTKVEKDNITIELTQISFFKGKARRFYNINNEDYIRKEKIDYRGYNFLISVSLPDELDIQANIEDTFFYDDDNNDLEIVTKSTDCQTEKINKNSFELTGECYFPEEKGYEIDAVSKIDIMLRLSADGELYKLSLDLKTL